MPCKIVIPSRKRAGKVLTKISDAILFVEKKEKDKYKEHYPEIEIETHDGLNSLSEIRQKIYERYGDVFMVDDDIQEVIRLYKCEKYNLNEEEIKEIIQKCYEMEKETGSKLFGFNNDPVPAHYNQHKPIMLNGYINGCAIGLIKSQKLYFSKETVACESHWINLLNAYYYRYNFIDKRFCFKQKKSSTFQMIGGQTGKRTLETEMKDTLYLKKMFGDSVQLKKEKNKTKQLHEYQRELRIKL
mgnify:CR=1 FL=1